MFKRILIGTLAIVIGGAGLTALSAPAYADTDPKTTILDDINAYRVQNGVGTLTETPAVESVAQDWANQLQQSPAQVMFHNPNFGQELAPATNAGEVVSQFYDPDQVATKWMLSNMHKPILLESSWNAVGVGYVYDPNTGYYWTVVNFAYYPPVSAKPDAPATPQVSVNDTNITATWNTPNSNNSPLQGYDVRLYKSDGTMVQDASSSSTTYTFQNIARGGSYYVKVAAYNANGQGGDSNPSQNVTVQALPPSAPHNLVLIRYATGTLLASWWGSAQLNGAQVSGYSLNLYQDGVFYQTVTVTGAVNTNKIISNIPDGHTYSFTIVSVADAGNSDFSAMSSSATLPVIPAPQPSVTTTAPQPTPTVTTAPTPTSAPTTSSTPISAPTSTSNVPVSNPIIVSPIPLPASILPVTNPTVVPTPVTSTGTTPALPVVNQPTVIPGSNRNLTVTWSPAVGSSITRYAVTLTAASGLTFTQNVTGSATNATFGNLDPTVTYSATVTALSDNGASVSQPSPAVKVAAPVKAPPAPKVKTKISHRHLTITWNRINTTQDSAIKKYVLTLTQGKTIHNYTVLAKTNTKTLTLPKANVTYTVKLTAYNMAGKHTTSVSNRVKTRR